MADVATLAASVLPKKVIQPKKKARTEEKKEVPKKVVSRSVEEADEQTEASKTVASKYRSPFVKFYDNNWMHENQLKKGLETIQTNPVKNNGLVDMNWYEMVIQFADSKPHTMTIPHADLLKVDRKIRELARRYSSGKPEDMMDNMEHQMYEHENVEQVPATTAPVRKVSAAPKKAPRKRKMKEQEVEQIETLADQQLLDDVERQINEELEVPDSDRSDDESELA